MGALKTPLHYKDSLEMKTVVPIGQKPILSHDENISVTKTQQIYGGHLLKGTHEVQGRVFVFVLSVST